MRIRRKWVRDLASMVFTVYYLIAAEQADEKVRKVRGMLTIDHLRVSWNKPTTPYLSVITSLSRPRLMRYPPRAIRIPRPPTSDYKEPVNGWLYFDGPLSALKNHTRIVLDIPGGGFVAMNPRTHDDRLFAWAGKTGIPVLSLDYKKAPEFPYPYALNECYDVYNTIVASRGRCIGLSGDFAPKIVVSGDSAGGNLAASLTLMIIESGSTDTRKYLGQNQLPIPDGLVLIYPNLDMNIGSWMSDEQMSLIKDRRTQKQNQDIISRKSMQYTHLAGTPHPSDNEDADTESPPKVASPSLKPAESAPEYSTASTKTVAPGRHHTRTPSASHHPQPLKTRLAMSSMISYFNDRILAPEMLRAMVILYIGPHNRPDFSTDYLLSPILAPDDLLAHFPKTYILTGERDPLVDDTVIFAGRLRRARLARYEKDLVDDGRLRKEFDDRDAAEVALIPGISHGFMQFVSVFPEGWKYIHKSGKWIDEIFTTVEEKELNSIPPTPGGYISQDQRRRRMSSSGLLSSGDEDIGLEMSMSSRSKAKQREEKETRKRKQKLLQEQLKERKAMRGMPKRQKSMVGLASEDDLLGRRMLGLAGSLTSTGDSPS